MRDELSLEMRRLVERARRDESPANVGLKRRVRQSVVLGIPSSALFGSGLAAASGSAASAGTGAALGATAVGKVSTGLLNGFLVWVAGGFALGIGATTAYVGWVNPRTDPRAPPTVNTASVATAQRADATPRPMPAATTTIEIVAPESSTGAPPPTGNSATTNRAPTSSTGLGQATADMRQVSSLADEVALLDRVQQKLRDGQGQAALEAVDEAALRFAHGQLAPDFQAARVLAWCELGQSARARHAANSFLRLHVASPLAERVRNSCAFSNTESAPSRIGR